MTIFHFRQGNSPLLVSMPHVGVRLAPEMMADLNDPDRAIMDTDWYLDQLYDFLPDMGISLLRAEYSRTVIDLNRGGVALYPGQSETELCPTTTFDNQALYRAGCEPDGAEILRRRKKYWQPYHDRLRAELDRIKAQYGYALLWDAHSIKSHVPRFFDGQLPDLNLGSGGGVSCGPALADGLLAIGVASPYSTVLNGRFKGGYITRHYGDPDHDIHAIQLEISQTTYMDEAPAFTYQNSRAVHLRPVLKAMISSLLIKDPEHHIGEDQ
ncbi:N-formylglutamate deformylase [hydrothermal vent metagenome]|uniref:N-formylglutamate deformylase n=1 Tax=hydrothermal vent metagenome TaxID=652676 RepID=A0A3B0RE01_9ZZZZ